MKSGDDVVAKENSYSVVIAPPLLACGWNPGEHGKTYVSQFLSDEAITIRNLLTRRCFMLIDGLNGRSKSLVLRQFRRIIAARLILYAQLVAASNVKSHRT